MVDVAAGIAIAAVSVLYVLEVGEFFHSIAVQCRRSQSGRTP